jgi:hypothetical protein
MAYWKILTALASLCASNSFNLASYWIFARAAFASARFAFFLFSHVANNNRYMDRKVLG